MTCGCNRPKDTVVASSVKPCSECVELKGSGGTPSVLQPIHASDFRTFQSVVPVTRVGDIIQARGLSMSTSLTTYATAYRPSGSPGTIVTSGLPVVPTGVASGIIASGVGGITDQPRVIVESEVDFSWCCIVDAGINQDKNNSFKCRKTVNGYSSAKDDRSPGITLPLATGDLIAQELLTRESAGGITEIVTKYGPKRHFLYEAWAKIRYHRGSQPPEPTPPGYPNYQACYCLVTQTFFVDPEGATPWRDNPLQKDLTWFMNERHKQHPEVNPGWRLEESVVMIGEQYTDYIGPWIRCCGTEPDGYIAFVDAPGGYSDGAHGVLNLLIKFESYGPVPSTGVQPDPAAVRCCRAWEILLRLYIGVVDSSLLTPKKDEFTARVVKNSCTKLW
jgi:hypothetical protein